MFSATLVQTARTLPKSLGKWPKGLHLAGGLPRCSAVPCSVEVLPHPVEAAGSAQGTLGPTQASRQGDQLCLLPQTVLRALRVSTAETKNKKHKQTTPQKHVSGRAWDSRVLPPSPRKLDQDSEIPSKLCQGAARRVAAAML